MAIIFHPYGDRERVKTGSCVAHLCGPQTQGNYVSLQVSRN